MPTATGKETIAEKLTRLRADLVDVRTAIKRATLLGSSFSDRGVSFSSVAIADLRSRERNLELEISRLEDRVAGVRRSAPGLMVIRNVQE